jgi:hypothetical protein
MTAKETKAFEKDVLTRCKDCQPDGIDPAFCKSTKCPLRNPSPNAVLRYGKDCRCGNPLDICGENNCTIRKWEERFIKEAAEKLGSNRRKND